MILLLYIYLAVTDPHSGAGARLAALAKPYLTSESATHQILAAQAAGLMYHVRPELLLAIAYHESRFQSGTRTKESGGRESCGVMTPTPTAHCTANALTVLGGYEAGAQHLQQWMKICGGAERCALLAYAGGGGLVRACERGRWLTPRGTDACLVARQFQALAANIGRLIR